jgi:hydrogenase maturation protein HypF
MAENYLEGEVIGVAMDGTGFGTDGTIWGCEFLVTGYRDFTRAGYLKPVPMPGGDQAAREPYRMAASYLHAYLGAGFSRESGPWAGRWDQDTVELLQRMIELGVNAPLTSSAGRLFDAVSSIIGICDRSTYDAQASIELEMAADESERGRYPYHIGEEGASLIIDPGETIQSIVADVKKGLAAGTMAARFHLTFVEIIVDMCRRLGRFTGLERVALSGGVFQNRFLVERVVPALQEAGFSVYVHATVPPNDGGMALGQVAVANEVSRSCA